MPSQNKEPTLQEIADRAGFARSTVSLALRNHPSLPEKTREKIHQAAEELGYRPNPLIAALMTQMRNRRLKKRESLAIVTRMQHAIGKAKLAYHRMIYEAIVKKADEHGFDIDEFHYDPQTPLSSKRLSNILVSRGIHGVLFFPGASNRKEDYPELDWEHFASVIIGFNTQRLELHQVVSDYTYDMDLTIKHISGIDEPRVGYAIPRLLDRLTNYSWSSRYLLYQSNIPIEQRLPLFHSPEIHMERDEFMKWFIEARPSIIISASPAANHIKNWLEEAGYKLPGDVRLVNLLKREEDGIAGINPHTREVGRAAVELLASLLQTNQRGLPEFPRTIAIKGHWSPGTTFPADYTTSQKG